MRIAGIDFGSKMAGTTAICFDDSGLQILTSTVKKDADEFLLKSIRQNNITHVFIDAPLSLPGVYHKPSSFNNYFYRISDQELSAMSPMFLGGLTARAMKLAAQLKESSVQCIETYPKQLALLLNLDKLDYKKKADMIPQNLDAITLYAEQMNFYNTNLPQVSNWHQFDALLAWISGQRWLSNVHISKGNKAEGMIMF